jgi:hypothetical protein
MSLLCELQELWLSRPSADAPNLVVAAWYEQKADVLEQMASTLRDAPREQAEQHASAARDHARRLRRVSAPVVVPA